MLPKPKLSVYLQNLKAQIQGKKKKRKAARQQRVKLTKLQKIKKKIIETFSLSYYKLQ